MEEVMKTCGNCNWYYDGSCEVKLPIWLEDIDPFNGFTGDENRKIFDEDLDEEKGCKCWRKIRSAKHKSDE